MSVGHRTHRSAPFLMALNGCDSTQKAMILAVLSSQLNGAKPGRALQTSHLCADTRGGSRAVLTASEAEQFGMSVLRTS